MVAISDAEPHLAGLLQLAGLVTPNDGGCYLSKTADDVWEYNRSTELVSDMSQISLCLLLHYCRIIHQLVS